MPKRMKVFASATLSVLAYALILSASSSSGEAAADNCLAKPNAPPPQGSHWYYRVDQVGNRRCWYLGPKDAKTRQAWSPKPQSAALSPQPKPASQLVATATAAIPAQLVAPVADARATSSALPASANAVDGEPASAINGAEHAAMHPDDDVPLTFPVLLAADLEAAERLHGWTRESQPVLVYVAAALALLMIVRKVFRLLGIRRLRRRRLALREQWNEERVMGSRGFAGTVAGTRPAHSRRKTIAVPRVAEIPRPPADDYDIQALEAKESLQQLLYARQRVAA